MAKKMHSFRLSDQAGADLRFCLDQAQKRLRVHGYGDFGPLSQSEVIEQALSRLAAYYRGLKPVVVKGKGGGVKKE